MNFECSFIPTYNIKSTFKSMKCISEILHLPSLHSSCFQRCFLFPSGRWSSSFQTDLYDRTSILPKTGSIPSAVAELHINIGRHILLNVYWMIPKFFFFFDTMHWTFENITFYILNKIMMDQYDFYIYKVVSCLPYQRCIKDKNVFLVIILAFLRRIANGLLNPSNVSRRMLIRNIFILVMFISIPFS